MPVIFSSSRTSPQQQPHHGLMAARGGVAKGAEAASIWRAGQCWRRIQQALHRSCIAGAASSMELLFNCLHGSLHGA